MLKISETFIIGIDIGDEGESCITVSLCDGKKHTWLNTIHGKDVIDIYKKFIGNKSESDDTSMNVLICGTGKTILSELYNPNNKGSVSNENSLSTTLMDEKLDRFVELNEELRKQ